MVTVPSSQMSLNILLLDDLFSNLLLIVPLSARGRVPFHNQRTSAEASCINLFPMLFGLMSACALLLRIDYENLPVMLVRI